MVKPLARSGSLAIVKALSRKLSVFIPQEGLLKAEGVHMDEAGALTKWQGFSKLNTTKLTEAGPVDATFTGLFQFTKSDNSSITVATTRNGVYFLSGSNFSSATLPPGYVWSQTEDDRTSFAVLEDVLYITGTGGQQNLKTTDGQTYQNMGIVAPVVGTFAGTPSNGAGALDVSATYQYKVTFYNAALDHESNPSLPITVTTGATDDTVTLSNIPISSDPQVTRRRLYRTQAGGAVWQFLDEIADNTTTVYVDLKADSALGIAVTEFANGVPPTASMLAIFQGIMFMVAVANPSRVYFSTQNRPNAVDSNDFRDLDPNDGTVITGLKRLYDTLVVFKRNSIWAGVGEDRETLGFVRQINGIGATCNDGILTVPGKTVLAFPSDNGFYTFNGTNEAYISSEIEPIYRQGGLNQSRLTTMVGTTYKARNMLMWFVSNGAAIQHDLAIVYDFTLDQWTTRSVAATRVNVAATITDSAGNEGFYIGGVGGFVWKGDTGLSDDGSAIQVDIIDRAHPRGNLTNTSRLSFRELWVWYRSELATTITVSYALDNPHVDDPDGNYTVLGTMNLTEGDGVSSLRFNAQGQRFYPRFTHTAIGAPLVIRGWAVDYKVLDRQS